MEVNGYQLQQRLSELKDERSILVKRFEKSIYQFDDEIDSSNSPEVLYNRLAKVEELIVFFELSQDYYNQKVCFVVNVEGESEKYITLAEAIKMIGCLNRICRLWKDAAQKDTTQSKYDWEGSKMQKSSDVIMASRVISVDKCLEHLKNTSRKAASYRKSIQTGNAVMIDIPDMKQEFFD